MSESMFLYAILAAALGVILYQHGQITERDLLLDYYRQPGAEYTVGVDPLVVANPVPATITWQAETGLLVLMTEACEEIEVYIPEEDGEWRTLARDSDFVRSIKLHDVLGQPRLLLKWRVCSSLTAV